MAGRSLVLALLLAASVAARADSSQEELARIHFVAGQEEYARGRWREALREFEAGYALSPRPEFLINFAQAHRRLGEYDAAASECRQYLATAPPTQLAAQAQRLLDQIEGERAHAPPPLAPSPAASPPAAASPTVSAPVLVVAPPPPARKRRVWIAPVVVAGVVVVAAAVTVALVFGLQASDSFKPTPLGTVDFR